MRKSDKRFIIIILFLIMSGSLLISKVDTVAGLINRFLILLTPLYVGLIIAFVLNRPIIMLQKQFAKIPLFKKGNRAAAPAIISAYLIFIGILVGLFFIIIPQLSESFSEFMGNFGSYSKQFMKLIEGLGEKLEEFRLDPAVLKTFFDKSNDLSKTIIDKAPKLVGDLLSGLVSTIGNILLGLLVSIYLLLDKNRLQNQFTRVVMAFTPQKRQSYIKHVMTLSNRVLSDYVFTQMTEALILGVICFVGMLIFRFPYALMISVFITVTALIPILGAYLGAAFGALLMLFVRPDLTLWFLLYLFVVQQFEGSVIYPRRVKGKIGLPAIWVLLSITVGGGLAGIPGAMLGVPIASILYQLSKEAVITREKQVASAENNKLAPVNPGESEVRETAGD